MDDFLRRLCRNATEGSPLPMIAVEGGTHRILYTNPALCRLTGKDSQDLVGHPFAEVVPELPANTCLALLDRVFDTGAAESLADQEHLNALRSPAFWSYTAWIVLDAQDQRAGVMVQVTDTTREVLLRQTLDELNQALLISSLKQHELTEEAEGLNARLQRAIRETHHRVKNNLQVVAALIDMQIGEDASADEHLERLLQHVRTLAGLHDLLTHQVDEDGAVSRIGVKAVLDRLALMLEGTSGGRRISASIAELSLPVHQVASLSLLVSECVSNALKHARGEVEVILRVADQDLHLEVIDDGDGFPEGFDPRTAAHTGLELIESLGRFDLRGRVRYENRPPQGGCVHVIFPRTYSAP